MTRSPFGVSRMMRMASAMSRSRDDSAIPPLSSA
jgi:hypothetical protein